LASVYILIKYLINTKVNSKKDIEKAIAVPIVAEIFKQEAEKGRKFFDAEPRSVLNEQVLNLRSNLMFLLNDVKNSPVILFTSSISGEGKTFLSAHLGKSLTSNRKKVVLIELDLRKPKLAKSLGVGNHSGLTNYILGVETLDDIIKKVPDADNLFLIPSGPIPPNPIELIEGEKMKELFCILKERFDYIIIDTAPFGLVSDAKSLTPYVDCALFVVRYNYTPKAKLLEVANNLTNTSFRKMGLIFNGIEQGSSYGYYSYGYSNYGYGYGYFGDENKNRIGSLVRQIRQRMI
jgi:capsular exopolysaccharide synthesis family protein